MFRVKGLTQRLEALRALRSSNLKGWKASGLKVGLEALRVVPPPPPPPPPPICLGGSPRHVFIQGPNLLGWGGGVLLKRVQHYLPKSRMHPFSGFAPRPANHHGPKHCRSPLPWVCGSCRCRVEADPHEDLGRGSKRA